MKDIRLALYSQESADILVQAMTLYLKTIYSHAMTRMEDNELVYLEDMNSSEPATVKNRLASILQQYADGSYLCLRCGDESDRRKAECLKLILLGQDKHAEKKFAELYQSLKGKPLNPLQIEAVAVIAKEIHRIEDEAVKLIERHTVMDKRGRIDKLSKKKEELMKQMKQISGVTPCLPTLFIHGAYGLEKF